MRPGSISTALLALACLAAAGLSARLLGPGLWGLMLLVAALVFAASPYVPAVREAVRGLALTAGVLALLTVALGLLAATTGGSFRLPGEQTALLAVIGLIGALGIIVHWRLKVADAPA